jgi:hypothetical protein
VFCSWLLSFDHVSILIAPLFCSIKWCINALSTLWVLTQWTFLFFLTPRLHESIPKQGKVICPLSSSMVWRKGKRTGRHVSTEIRFPLHNQSDHSSKILSREWSRKEKAQQVPTGAVKSPSGYSKVAHNPHPTCSFFLQGNEFSPRWNISNNHLCP